MLNDRCVTSAEDRVNAHWNLDFLNLQEKRKLVWEIVEKISVFDWVDGNNV